METQSRTESFSGLSAGTALALGLVFAAAVLLRLWNVGFGLPDTLHLDEPPKAQAIRRIVGGERPDYFLHPGLLVNQVAMVVRIHAAARAGSSARSRLDDPSIIRMGRVLVAVVGALTLFPFFFLARSILGKGDSIAASCLFLFAPLHVIHSRYLKEDVHLVFGVVLVLLGLVRWRQSREKGERRPGWIVLAIVGVGWAVAAKFTGIVMLPFLLATAWWNGKDWKQRAILAGLVAGGTLLVFGILSPQVLLDVEAVARDLPNEFVHGAFSPSGPGLYVWQRPDLGTWFLFHAIGPGLSWPATAFALAGGAIALARGKRNPDLLLLSVTALAWYILIELSPLKRGVDVERYALPCLAPMAILAVWAARRVMERWGSERRCKPLAGALLLFLVAIPFVHSIALTAAIETDTRRLASQWLSENGPREPYRLGVLNEAYPGAESPRAIPVIMNIFDTDEMKTAARSVDVITIESFFTDRYEQFPGLSRKKLRALNWLRAEYPRTIIFRKPAYLRAGFHNPTVEIRFREKPADSMTAPDDSTLR